MAIPYDPPPDERTPQRDPQTPRRDAPRTPEDPRDPSIHKPSREAPGQREPDERDERDERDQRDQGERIPDRGRRPSMRRAMTRPRAPHLIGG